MARKKRVNGHYARSVRATKIRARSATIAAGTSQIQRNIIAGLMGLKV